VPRPADLRSSRHSPRRTSPAGLPSLLLTSVCRAAPCRPQVVEPAGPTNEPSPPSPCHPTAARHPSQRSGLSPSSQCFGSASHVPTTRRTND